MQKNKIKLEVAVIWLILLGLFSFYNLFEPTITGKVVGEETYEYIDIVSKSYTENSTYIWQPGSEGLLSSAGISGQHSKTGKIKIYLETENSRYLLYSYQDTENSGNLITGFTALEDEQANNSSVNFTDFVDSNESVVILEINDTIINIEENNNSINLILEYASDSNYDIDNNGVEELAGIIDFTAENSETENLNQDNLCTLWSIYSEKSAEETIICNGNNDCCNDYNLQPTELNWNERFFLYYGQYGATESNIVTAKIIYKDENLTIESDTKELQAKFIDETKITFENSCLEACALPGLNETQYTIVIEIEDSALEFNTINYNIIEKIITNTPPELIKDFNNITIEENSYYKINLSEYFIDIDNDELEFDYFQNNNIDITIDKGIATLTPVENFTGLIFMYFEASDGQRNEVSDIFSINVTEPEEKELVQLKAEIGKPVKWVRKFTGNNVSIPEYAENISVNKFINQQKIKINNNKFIVDRKIMQDEKIKPAKGLQKVMTLEEFDLTEKAETKEEVKNITVSVEETADSFELEYFTQAPTATEINISDKIKKIIISSDIHYTDILTYTSIPETKQNNIRLYWIRNNTRVLFTNVTYNDTNSNGLIDRLEWVTPHLSNQTFEVDLTTIESEFDAGTYNWTYYNGSALIINQTGDNYTKLLLHFNGPDDSTNDADFVDSSGKAHSVTQEGNAKLENTQSKFGGTSAYFDGTDDYISITDHEDFNFGSDNFTIDFWIYPASVSNSRHIMGQWGTSGENEWYSDFRNDGNIYFQFVISAAAKELESNTKISTNTWYHIAIVRNNSEARLYINGSEDDRNTGFSGVIQNSPNSFEIGRYWSGATEFSGYIDELRISKGIARWTGNFTPPEREFDTGVYESEIFDTNSTATWHNISWYEPVPYGEELPNNRVNEELTTPGGINMTDNILLYHFNNDSAYGEDDTTVNDFSGNNLDGTVTNSPKFNSTDKKFGAGSYEFDGTNTRRISISNADTFYSDSLTVSIWIKLNSYTEQQAGIYEEVDPTDYKGIFLGMENTASADQIDYYLENNIGTNTGLVTGNTVLNIGQWYHVVLTYNSSHMLGYLNGKEDITPTAITGNIVAGEDANIGLYDDSSREFDGNIDELAIWNRSLSETEILNIYRRGVNRLNISVRSCDDSSCSGEAWTDIEDKPYQNLSLTDNRYFQYRADLETDDTLYTPELYNVSFHYTNYSDTPGQSNPSIISTTGNNLTSDNLICYNQSTVRSDLGSYVVNSFRWYKNGILNATMPRPDDDRIFAYFPFNDNQTSTAYDYANGNDGAITQAVWNASGKIGGAYDIVNGGSADYIAIGPNILVNLSVSLWVRLDSLDGWADIISKGAWGGAADWYFQLSASDDGNVCFTANTDQSCSPGPYLDTGVWHHIVITANGSDATTYEWNFYKDGDFWWTYNNAQNHETNTKELCIGGGTSGSVCATSALDGRIDEVIIWNRTITAEEVKLLYRAANFSVNNTNDFSLINSTYTNRGDNWTCEITPMDYLGAGTALNSSILIETGISQTTPLVESTSGNNITTDDLFCHNQSTSNLDGYFNVNAFRWYKNGILNATSPTRNDNSLILYFPSNINDSGSNVNDYSQYDNDGAQEDGVTWNQTGRIGGSFTFDGIDDNIQLPYIEIRNRSFSVSAWVRPDDDFVDQASIFGAHADFAERESIHLRIIDTGVFRFGMYSSDIDTSSGVITFGEWNHIVAVFDNVTNTSYIYVNGEQKASATPRGPFKGDNADFELGTWRDGVGQFNGSIDEFAIWNRSLSATEVSQLYQSGKFMLNSSNSFSQINASETSRGDNWTCEITPMDYLGAGNPLNSSTLTINDVPSVTLNSPTNNNDSVNFSNVIFNCSVDDDDGNLKNVSLYSDYNGSWKFITSNSVLGSSNSTTFTRDIYTDIGGKFIDSEFKWNCYACDSVTDCEWATSNFTFSGWDLGTYNWSVKNGTSITINQTGDNYTKLLLHFNGPDGSTTDADFVDSSGKAHSVSQEGNTNLTANYYKFGGTAAGFDGDDDYITVADSNDWDFGSDDFTVDWWEYRHNTANYKITLSRDVSTTYAPFIIGYSLDGNLRVYMSSDGGSWDIASNTFGAIDVNTWTHYAVVRSGNNFYTFKNGNQSDNWSSTLALIDNSNPLSIGTGQGLAFAYDFNGSIDELRISKGIARWTGNFTPPERELDTGEYLSKVFDAGSLVSYNNITWDNYFPYGEELPMNRSNETKWLNGNINMSSNILYLRLNNNSAYGENDSLFYDFSGNGNNGTCTGTDCPTYNSSGRINGSFYWDNSNDDVVEIADSHYWKLDRYNFTISLWVKFLSTSDVLDYFIGQDDFSGSRSWGLWYQSGQIDFADDISGGQDCSVSWTPSKGQWHHLVFLREDLQISKYYVDGVQVGSDCTTNYQILDSGNPLYIGSHRYSGAQDREFHGSFDEVAIWNRSLSAKEIKNIYKRGVMRLNISTRTSDDGISWSDFVKRENPSNLIDSSAQFIQYKVNMETDDTLYSPELLRNTVNISYIDISDPSVVTLNAPVDNNNSVNFSDAVFNCSFTDIDNDMDNVSLYSDYNGTWKLIDTVDLDGGNYSTLFTRNIYSDRGGFVDSEFKWNCLVKDGTNEIFAGSNFTFSGWDLGKYNWSSHNGSAIIINQTGDNYTKLLLHFNGPDDSTNDADFIDSSGKGHSVTQEADAKIENTQSKFGGTSAYFDGTGDYITIPLNSDWNFGNEDFTIDFWINFNTVDTYMMFLEEWVNGGASDCSWMFGYSEGDLMFYWSTNGAYNVGDSITYTWSPSTGTWYHMAVTRNDSNFYLFIDGVEKTTKSSSDTFASPTQVLEIGSLDNVASWDFNGYIDELRISKGIARWTGNFTPPERELDTGEYVSQVFDAGSIVSYNNITWDNHFPYGKELPINRTNETKYEVGNINMTGNVVYYRFNNDSGYGEDNDDFYDFSGMGNDATCSGTTCPTWDKAGKINGSYDFDGSEDFINTPNNLFSEASFVNGITLSVWIKPDTTPDNTDVIFGVEGRATIQEDGENANRWSFYIYDSSSVIATANEDVVPGNWVHLVGVWNTSHNLFYVNGILQDDIPSSPTFSSIDDVSRALDIGKTSSSSSLYFDGKMDEAAIWNRSLSAKEIKNIYKRGVMRLNISTRTSDDGSSWNDFTTIQNPSNLIDSSTQFIQYKINLETDDTRYTPELLVNTINISFSQDTLLPIINGSVNKSTLYQYDYVNATFNVTDETALDYGMVIINDTGYNRYFNFSLSGTEDQLSQNFTISCTLGCVINITGWVNDTSGNYAQNETIFTVSNQPMTVTLNSPGNGNNSINYSSVIFNCSAADNDSIRNISLYSNYNGSWKQISTNELIGTVNSTAFTRDIFNDRRGFVDSEFKWNCLVYDQHNESSWATSNFTFSGWDLGKYNWSSHNGSAIIINQTGDNYTKLLLHFNGPDDSTNDADFVDSSGKGHSVTQFNDAKLENTQSKFEGTSVYFDGSGGYLTVPDSSDWDFSNGDFTVDFWMYKNSDTKQENLVSHWVNTNTDASFSITTNHLGSNSGKFYVLWQPDGEGYDFDDSTASFVLNTWIHVALVRNSTNLLLFVNGTSHTLATDLSNKDLMDCTGSITIGGFDGTTQNLDGYIDEVRISKGIARWTGNFTPPERELDTAEYVSQIFDAGSLVSYNNISWGNYTVEGTNITVQARTSDDGESWSGWSSELSNPSDTIDSSAQYIQYKAEFATNDTSITPELLINTVNISYVDISDPSVVTLNTPVDNNNSVNFSDAVFNCSFTDIDNDMDNVSLYSDYNGTWKLIDTVDLNGGNYSTTFIRNVYSDIGGKFIDSEFKWNCLVTDEYNNQASASSNFTFSGWDLGKYNWSSHNGSAIIINQTGDNYTKLLLHFNGPDDSTNDADFVDSSGKGHSVTQEADAKIENTQSKFGGTSAYFDGAGDKLSTPDSEDWNFGSGDFTVDFWMYKLSDTKAESMVRQWVSTNTDASFAIVANRIGENPGKFYVLWQPDGAGYGSDADAADFSLNVWTHVALVRNDTNLMFFVNGEKNLITDSLSGALMDSSGEVVIGGTDIAADTFDGYIDELRISKGIARWTGNFTPPERELDTGEYLSKVFDAGSIVSFNNISWDRSFPYGEELPMNGENETESQIGNINMSGNVLYMRFNNDSDYGENNTFVKDFSGFGNNGTTWNGAHYNQTDKILGNSAIHLDGQNDYINISDSDSLDIDGQITICTWARRLGDGIDPVNGEYLYNKGVNEITLLFVNTASAMQYVTGGTVASTTVSIGDTYEWHHWCSEFDPTTDVVNFYKDGTILESVTQTGTPSTADGDITIGHYTSASSNRGFFGIMDELAVWNRSLSSQEILDIYKRGATRLNISTRTSDDASVWSDFTTMQNPSNLIDSSAQFIQYKVNLKTDDTSITPELLIKTVNISYVDMPDPSVVTLNAPVNNNNSVNFSDVVFNCSFTDIDNDMDNVSLYSDYNGTWKLIDTVDLDGGNYSTTFIRNVYSDIGGKFIDSEFKWNCLVTDEYNNQASASSNFTFSGWDLGKYNWSSHNGSAIIINQTGDNYTKLLLHFNGPDDSTTDADFIDSSGKGHTVTQYNNAKLENTQKKFGDTAAYFDGTNDYIVIPDHADWDFANGDFTLDFWVNRMGNTGRHAIISQWGSDASATNDNFWLEFSTTHLVSFSVRYTDQTGGGMNSVQTITDSDWHHIAIVREGDESHIYIDGIDDGITGGIDPAKTVATTGIDVYLGTSNAQTFDFTGYIDELRITKGKARWTGNFTPPERAYDRAGYESRVFDAGSFVSFDNISWGNYTVEGTNITMQARTSDDGESWSGWSSELSNPSDTIDSFAQYIQYKAEFATSVTNMTPELLINTVNISYSQDTLLPIVNGSINKSTLYQYDYVNATFNTTDNIGLDYGMIIFNDTGYNRYFNFSLSGTVGNFSQNFTVSCESGCVINITGWVNDTSGNININDTLITVASPDTCSCPTSGDWNIDASDNCVISSDCAMQNNNVVCYGSGYLVLNAKITNYNIFVAHQGCNVICRKTDGCFG